MSSKKLKSRDGVEYVEMTVSEFEDKYNLNAYYFKRKSPMVEESDIGRFHQQRSVESRHLWSQWKSSDECNDLWTFDDESNQMKPPIIKIVGDKVKKQLTKGIK